MTSTRQVYFQKCILLWERTAASVDWHVTPLSAFVTRYNVFVYVTGKPIVKHAMIRHLAAVDQRIEVFRYVCEWYIRRCPTIQCYKQNIDGLTGHRHSNNIPTRTVFKSRYFGEAQLMVCNVAWNDKLTYASNPEARQGTTRTTALFPTGAEPSSVRQRCCLRHRWCRTRGRRHTARAPLSRKWSPSCSTSSWRTSMDHTAELHTIMIQKWAKCLDNCVIRTIKLCLVSLNLRVKKWIIMPGRPWHDMASLWSQLVL